jgi:predicted RNA-binding Zn-ribbon protein involved in translation (DUF1610 family)
MPSSRNSAELTCLSCHASVAEQEARLYQKVFVCPRCQESAQKFEASVREDLRNLQQNLDALLRIGIRSGEFNSGEFLPFDEPSERLDALVRWLEQKDAPLCPVTPMTPRASPPILSSGDGTKPHAATLRTLAVRGPNGSPSSTG